MMSRVIALLACLSFWSTRAFHLFSASRGMGLLRRQSCEIRLNYKADTNNDEAKNAAQKEKKSENIFEEILRSFLEAFPWLMTGEQEMDPEKLVDEPPKFLLPATADEMGKSSEARKLSRKEAVDKFIRKYLPFWGEQNKPHDRSTALDGDSSAGGKQ